MGPCTDSFHDFLDSVLHFKVMLDNRWSDLEIQRPYSDFQPSIVLHLIHHWYYSQPRAKQSEQGLFHHASKYCRLSDIWLSHLVLFLRPLLVFGYTKYLHYGINTQNGLWLHRRGSNCERCRIQNGWYAFPVWYLYFVWYLTFCRRSWKWESYSHSTRSSRSQSCTAWFQPWMGCWN